MFPTAWRINQPNTILFVLIDSSGAQVTGLGSNFNLSISKAGGSFLTATGTKSEVGLGWYKYVSTSAEADTVGPLAISCSGSGTITQNLEYVVDSRVIGSVEFSYSVTNTVGGTPLGGVLIYIYTDQAGANMVWSGLTDSFGVARDQEGDLPRLYPGTYYIRRSKPGFVFSDPDVEVIP